MLTFKGGIADEFYRSITNLLCLIYPRKLTAKHNFLKINFSLLSKNNKPLFECANIQFTLLVFSIHRLNRKESFQNQIDKWLWNSFSKEHSLIFLILWIRHRKIELKFLAFLFVSLWYVKELLALFLYGWKWHYERNNMRKISFLSLKFHFTRDSKNV